MEQRRYQRSVVSHLTRCFLDGEDVRLFVYDMCVDGCCIDTADIRVALGETIDFQFIDGVNIEGRVVWKSDCCAGMQFTVELHPAVILHLGFKLVAVSINEFVPRDRFGRELPSNDGWTQPLLSKAGGSASTH